MLEIGDMLVAGVHPIFGKFPEPEDVMLYLGIGEHDLHYVWSFRRDEIRSISGSWFECFNVVSLFKDVHV